jgi:hypothetical protein
MSDIFPGILEIISNAFLNLRIIPQGTINFSMGNFCGEKLSIAISHIQMIKLPANFDHKICGQKLNYASNGNEGF